MEKLVRLFVFTVLCSCIAWSTAAFSQESSASIPTVTSGVTTSTATLDQAKPAAKKPWSILLGLERASNMMESSDPGAEIETSLLINPSYKINERLSTSLSIALAQQEVGPRDLKTSDTSISLTAKGWDLTDKLSTSHTFTGIAATNIDSIERDHLQGGLSVGNSLKLASTWGNYSYTLGVRRNFHEFTVNRDRSPNIAWTVSQRVIGDTPIWGKFSLLSDLGFRNGWTYENFERQSFSFSFDIAYSATDKLSINLGTTNEGSAVKANGTDSNLSVFDNKTTVLRLGVNYVL